MLLYLEGRSRREISEILHIPGRTVSGYISLYVQGGVEALLIRKQPERAKFLTDAQEKELFHIISTCTPKEAGVGVFTNWTAPLACRLMEERFHVKFSKRGVRDFFYRIGLNYARPTYTLDKADPQKQDVFRQKLECLKKLLNGEISAMLYEDESMIRDYQAIMKHGFLWGSSASSRPMGNMRALNWLDFWIMRQGASMLRSIKK